MRVQIANGLKFIAAYDGTSLLIKQMKVLFQNFEKKSFLDQTPSCK